MIGKAAGVKAIARAGSGGAQRLMEPLLTLTQVRPIWKASEILPLLWAQGEAGKNRGHIRPRNTISAAVPCGIRLELLVHQVNIIADPNP